MTKQSVRKHHDQSVNELGQLPPEQSEFRKHHSTNDKLFVLTQALCAYSSSLCLLKLFVLTQALCAYSSSLCLLKLFVLTQAIRQAQRLSNCTMLVCSVKGKRATPRPSSSSSVKFLGATFDSAFTFVLSPLLHVIFSST